MANEHYGKLSEIWKHGVLAELLDVQRPTRYAESHAGSASYPLIRSHERAYGILRFMHVKDAYRSLAGSALGRVLDGEAGEGAPARCPGSPTVAMSLLGDTATYAFFDTDPQSVASIRTVAGELLNHAVLRAEQQDGCRGALDFFSSDPSGCAHIDPFDPFEATDGPSAIELASLLTAGGTTVAYWYGYESEADRFWAMKEIAGGAPRVVWAGDVLCAEPETDSGIVGCGVVLTNAPHEVIARIERFGGSLASAYTNAPLPSGATGSIAVAYRSGGTSA